MIGTCPSIFAEPAHDNGVQHARLAVCSHYEGDALALEPSTHRARALQPGELGKGFVSQKHRWPPMRLSG